MVEALRAGDESAFVQLVDGYGPSMLRVAKLYVRTQAVAEEVVQETWIQILRSIDAFEGRSSLRTWIFVILGNCARRRAEREGRYVSFGAYGDGPEEPAVDPARFFPAEHPRWGGMWTTLVDGWEHLPDQVLMSGEARAKITEAIGALPPNYATVFTLRDIEGWEGSDVCALLGITPENQRVLLHRARARIRAALEEYFDRDQA
jgi:RNA polymerase sigma-70 factor (ECF subfamily)